MEQAGDLGSKEHIRNTKRKPNSEYNSPFICNLFFCFFFQFVCRLSDVQDEDIYDVHPMDRTETVTKDGEEFWNKRRDRYFRLLEQYEHDKDAHPGFVLKHDIVFIVSLFHSYVIIFPTFIGPLCSHQKNPVSYLFYFLASLTAGCSGVSH